MSRPCISRTLHSLGIKLCTNMNQLLKNNFQPKNLLTKHFFADISIYASWRHQKLKFEYLLIFMSNWGEILYTYSLICSLLESKAIFSKWRFFLLTSAFILHDVIKKLKFEYLLIFKSNRSEILHTYSLRCSLSESKAIFSNWRNLLLTSAFLKN